MRIAMIGGKVIPSRRGGIETVLTALCPALVKRGAEVTCYNRSSHKVENEYVGTVQNRMYEGVRLRKAHTFKMRGISAAVAAYSGAVSCLFGHYDVIHFHAEGPCASMWIPKMFGKKCIATVHGLDWKREKWRRGYDSRYILLGEKRLVRYADEIIVLSKSAQEYFKNTYNRDTVLIPNGIQMPTPKPVDIIGKEYGLKKDGYICLCSRLTEEKGIHFLIEAYGKLKTDKKLVICGATSDTDEYVERIREMAAGNENILFTGFISGDTLAEVYSNAYIVCLPSTIEGMSLSLLEGMAYGNAVVCSDIPENADVCQDYAVTFQSGNADDLAEKLQDLIDNENKVNEIRNVVAKFVTETYSFEKTADLTFDLYKKVLSK